MWLIFCLQSWCQCWTVLNIPSNQSWHRLMWSCTICVTGQYKHVLGEPSSAQLLTNTVIQAHRYWLMMLWRQWAANLSFHWNLQIIKMLKIEMNSSLSLSSAQFYNWFTPWLIYMWDMTMMRYLCDVWVAMLAWRCQCLVYYHSWHHHLTESQVWLLLRLLLSPRTDHCVSWATLAALDTTTPGRNILFTSSLI